MAEDGTQYGQLREDGHGNQSVAADADVESAWIDDLY